ncbi:MAG TPA: hypothetical protein VG756_13340 [Pseudonocardiaceae bacterium]|jgi:hypothetical protein|nr:hypothetical protein [Pseudonocardiaceae bacterium]
MSGAHVLAVEKPPPRPAGLSQPWRGLVALGEVVLAAVAVIVGILCWHRGFTQIVTPVSGQQPLVSTVQYGNWASGAVGLVVLAGLLVLDAGRQTLLAVRTRQRPAPELPADDEDDLEPDQPSS